MCYQKNKIVYSSELLDFLHVLIVCLVASDILWSFLGIIKSYFQLYANVEILFKLTFDHVVFVLNVLECLWNIYSVNKQNTSQNQIKH